MASQFLSWSQMNGLPDDILADSEVPKPAGTSWTDLQILFSPEREPFNPSPAWHEALKQRPVLAPWSLCQVSAGCKAESLAVQLTSNLRDRACKVADPTSECLCSFQGKVISQYNPVEGSVLILKNVTVLPGLVLNITIDNIVKIIN